MNFLTSNFNLMESNNLWDSLKKNKVKIDKIYNGLVISLNKNNLNKHNFFHFVVFIDYSNFEKTKKELKSLIKLIKKNNNKHFFVYLIYNFNQNPILEKRFDDDFQKIRLNLKNLNIKILYQNNSSLISERNKIYIRFPFEIKFINYISKEIRKNIIFYSSKAYKLIILDCDNTLWGGILDEDGTENIKYSGDGNGQIFKDFQTFLKNKKQEGFLLSISSKNNEKNVWDVMKKRDMILQKKDFINPKINWEDKAKNINQLINQLTLRPQDCVFIDDNPLEIEKVKSQIKNINIISSSNPLEIIPAINSDPRFFKYRILKEDANKYKQYQLKSKFEDISKGNEHPLSFYKNLKQNVIFEKIKEKNFDRALQLFNKTNQFNFTLNRYTGLDLKKLTKNKLYSLEIISFKDKFGDHGIIGAYIAKKGKNKIDIIDFVLSCRVLNRFLEDYVILRIINKNKNNSVFIQYKKDKVNNELIPKFMKKNYFELISREKNNFKYIIKNNNKYDEIERIFNN